MNYLPLSWRRLHLDTHLLAKKIILKKDKYDLIVAIARGGLTIAHILSDFLELPIATFTIASYKDFQQYQEPKIIIPLGKKLNKQKVLLVDDVSDTGKSFHRGIKYLKELGAQDIVTAAPYIKPWTKHFPDYYVKAHDAWIIFPYDMRETVKTLILQFKKQGLGEKKIKQQFKTIRIPKVFQ